MKRGGEQSMYFFRENGGKEGGTHARTIRRNVSVSTTVDYFERRILCVIANTD